MKNYALCIGLVAVGALLFSACTANVTGIPEPRPAPDTDLANARVLIANYGCGSCHTIPGIPGANSMAAPPLERFYERSYIAGRLPNTTDALVKWIQDPQEIEPGTAMPDLGVTASEAKQIAAYLYRQPTILDVIVR